MITLKRAYDYQGPDPGSFSILIDGLWPRGLSKNDFKPDEWLREIAPSSALRSWFGHDPAKWKGFKKKYLDELKEKTDLLQRIKKLEKEHGRVVLLYAARDTEHNNAVALLDVLQKNGGQKGK